MSLIYKTTGVGVTYQEPSTYLDRLGGTVKWQPPQFGPMSTEDFVSQLERVSPVLLEWASQIKQQEIDKIISQLNWKPRPHPLAVSISHVIKELPCT